MHHLHKTLTLVEAGAPLLDIDDVKLHLKVETDDDDTLITGLMSVAQGFVDGRDGILGRAMLTQQWRLERERFADWPRHWGLATGHGALLNAHGPLHWRRQQEIRIPLPPLVEVDSITYTDPSYVEQTLDPSQYRMVAGGGAESVLLPIRNACWPATACEPDAVKITFTCGYPDTASLQKERPGVIESMLLLIGHWYENREAALVADRAAAVNLPFAVEALLAPHRLHPFGT